MGRFVTLVEVGPRDGLQNEPTILPTEAKIAFINRAIDAGLKHIEAVSFVNPKKVPQMADAEAVMAGVPRDRGAVYSGLVLNRRGFDRAVAAGCDEILFVTSSTDSFEYAQPAGHAGRRCHRRLARGRPRGGRYRHARQRFDLQCASAVHSRGGCWFPVSPKSRWSW